MFRAI